MSVKQSLTVMPIMDVEFVSYFKATSHGIWLKSFISSLRVMDSIFKPLRIFYDNLTVVFIAKNNKNESQNKHIDIKYLAIRECIKENKVVIEYISIELIIANPLTKRMPPMMFKDHVVQMRLDSILWIWCNIYIIGNET